MSMLCNLSKLYTAGPVKRPLEVQDMLIDFYQEGTSPYPDFFKQYSMNSPKSRVASTDVAKMPLHLMASSLSSMAPAMAAPALTSVPLPSSSTSTSESSVTSSITYLQCLHSSDYTVGGQGRSRAGQAGAGEWLQGRAGPGTSRVRQGRAEQGRAGRGRAGRSR